MNSMRDFFADKTGADAKVTSKSIIIAACISALCIAALLSQSAAASAFPKRILFTGNSFSFYNNGIHNHVSSLVRSADEWEKGNRFRLLTLSGSHIHEHLPLLDAMLTREGDRWDALVLQGHSNEPVSSKKRKEFKQSMDKAINMIKEKSILPILFMTWEYEGETKMGKNLAQAYVDVAAKHNVPVVPVGLAFAKSQQLYPDISLYVQDVLGVTALNTAPQLIYRKDVKHPSQAGTYLAACVFYAALYNKSPEGLAFIADLPPKQAAKLQVLAWQVVEDFKK
jgi:hypothetical protein